MDPRRTAVARWVRRYLPCELSAGIASLAAFLAALGMTGSLVATAFAAVIGDAAGFYGLAAAREIRLRHGLAVVAGRRLPLMRAILSTVRSLAVEFGPGEVIGSVLVRPGLLIAMPAIVGDPIVGWVLGTLTANAVFYAVTITSFELSRLSRRRVQARVVVG